MDRLAIQSWFNARSRPDKVTILLDVMHELTILVRVVFYDFTHDSDRQLALMFKISEMNHAFTSAARAMMKNETTYPDDVLIEILLDQTSYPELGPGLRHALNTAIERTKARDGRFAR